MRGAGSAAELALARHIGLAAATGLLFTLASILWLPGWAGATLGVGQGVAWCALLLRRGHPWHRNVAIFGLTAGFTELLADLWLVRGIGALRYPPGGPFLLASPAYMPAAWLGMLSAGVALGVLLRRRGCPLGWASVAVAAALGGYIPAYEALARRAGWWSYECSSLIGGAVPPFIVAGEVLLALPLVAVTERLARAGAGAAALAGICQGLWIFASYGLAWAWLGCSP